MTEDCTAHPSAAVNDSDAKQIAAVFKAMADPLRLRMLSAVARDPRGESCVCDLTELSDVSQPTVSHHLKVLREAGLLEAERRGTWVWYRVTEQHRSAVSTALEMFRPARPTVLFVCVHNAGRSQMAAGFLRELAGNSVDVRSAGSLPADQLNPVAVEVMQEEGIDITSAIPKVLSEDAVKTADIVITMGCGDVCPLFPGKRYEDWELDDPAGQEKEAVREIRDEIRERIEALILSLT